MLKIRHPGSHDEISPTYIDDSSIITINICGEKYETYLSTIEYYPDTLLGSEKRREPFWNSKRQEYFFDRNRHCFSAILHYYQSQGRLHRPNSVPLETFIEEIKFFDLGEEVIEKIKKHENIKELKRIPMPKTLWRRYIWFYMEYPQHSVIARVIYIVSIILTFLSCITLTLESLPVYRDKWNSNCTWFNNVSSESVIINDEYCSKFYSSPFFIIQSICVAYFTTEYILRLISTPSYRAFFLSVFNWIDLIVIVSYYVLLILESIGHPRTNNLAVLYGLRLFRILRFMRIIRLYLVLEEMKSLRVLTTTIRESAFDFLIMFTIVVLLAFIFGSAVYYAEQQSEFQLFDSVPLSLYWGIITITGVG